MSDEIVTVAIATVTSMGGALVAHGIQPTKQCRKCAREQESIIFPRILITGALTLGSLLAGIGLGHLALKVKK